jgi:hypothetical protein
MNGPYGLRDIKFIAPEDAVVSPLRGQFFMRKYPKPEHGYLVQVFDHSSQTLAEGLVDSANESRQATQWLLDITGAKLNCETAPLTQTGSFIYY